jgi:hypothetical protein
MLVSFDEVDFVLYSIIFCYGAVFWFLKNGLSGGVNVNVD